MEPSTAMSSVALAVVAHAIVTLETLLERLVVILLIRIGRSLIHRLA